MDKQNELEILNKELKNIEVGESILKDSRKLIELQIKNRIEEQKEIEELRAITIQLNRQPKMQGLVEDDDFLLNIQQEDFSENDCIAEQENIERKEIQELLIK